MEIKTIISSICLLLLAVSCSMDDDALRDIEKGHSGSAVTVSYTHLTLPTKRIV